jgi:hypothetical protein
MRNLLLLVTHRSNGSMFKQHCWTYRLHSILSIYHHTSFWKLSIDFHSGRHMLIERKRSITSFESKLFVTIWFLAESHKTALRKRKTFLKNHFLKIENIIIFHLLFILSLIQTLVLSDSSCDSINFELEKNSKMSAISEV